MATYTARKLKLSWKELGETLSKAAILLPDEDIDNLTLVKPRQLLLHTVRPGEKPKEG